MLAHRAAPFIASAVWLVAACGDGAASPQATEAAQVGASCTLAPAEDDETTEKILQAARERATITLVDNAGDGCDAKLANASSATKRGLLQLYLERNGLKLRAGSVPSTATKHCRITLKVSGAGGYRYAITSLLYVGGYAMLTPGAEARFSARVGWSGREPLGSPPEPWSLAVPAEPDDAWVPSAQWRYNQEFVHAQDRASGCLAADGDSAEVTIDTVLSLDNKDGRFDAELDVTSMTGQASRVPGEPASMQLALEPQRCE